VKTINWKLKAALVAHFGTQVEAAKRLGIRESRLSYIVNGHVEPSDNELRALAREFGRTIVRKLLNQEKSSATKR